MEFNFIKIFGGGKTLVDVGLFIPDSVEKIVLAFSSGEQSKETAQKDYESWLEAAKEENCLILAPCAPENMLFHEGSELLIPKILEVFFQSLEQEPRKLAIVGVGSGSESAKKTHSLFPDLFTKLSTFEDPSLVSKEDAIGSWDS